MSKISTDQLVKELLNRISDYEGDPDPQWDELFQIIPNHVRLQLKHALLQSHDSYCRNMHYEN